MKILLINDHAAPRGGAELNLLMMRNGLRKRGHDARLFASTAVVDGQESPDYSCYGTTSRFRTLVQTANPFAYFRLRSVLKEFQPDVVYTKIFLTQLSPLILHPLKNIPTVHNVCWYRVICPKGTKFLPDSTVCHLPAGRNCYSKACLPLRDWFPLMLQHKLYHRWQQNIDVTLAYSNAVKKRLESEGFKDVQTLTYGFHRPQQIPAQTAASPLVVFAGRLVPEKGVDVLLSAFAQVIPAIPAARLLIAGEGPEAKRLQQMAVNLQIADHVSFAGFIPREDLDAMLAPAWVQAVPSLWEEPFGNVAVEAMMRGTTVIAARSGGLEEIIDHENTGLLVPPGSIDALADALLLVLQNEPLRKRLAANALKTATEKYDAEDYLSRIEVLLLELAANNNKSSLKGN